MLPDALIFSIIIYTHYNFIVYEHIKNTFKLVLFSSINFLYQQAGIYILLWKLVFTLAGIFLTTSPVRQKSCNFCLCIVWVSFYVLPRQLRFLESYSYYTSWICEMAVRKRVLWDTIFPSTTGLFFRFAFCSNCFKVFFKFERGKPLTTQSNIHLQTFLLPKWSSVKLPKKLVLKAFFGFISKFL